MYFSYLTEKFGKIMKQFMFCHCACLGFYFCKIKIAKLHCFSNKLIITFFFLMQTIIMWKLNHSNQYEHKHVTILLWPSLCNQVVNSSDDCVEIQQQAYDQERKGSAS